MRKHEIGKYIEVNAYNAIIRLTVDSWSSKEKICEKFSTYRLAIYEGLKGNNQQGKEDKLK